MKFVHFADLHLNNVQSGKMNGVIPVRVLDVLGNLQKLVDFVIERKVDYVFFSGDAYKNSKPQNMYRTMFHDQIMRVSEYSKIIMIPGNHDMTRRDGAKHALSEFKHLKVPNVYILDNIGFAEFDDCVILSVPWQYSPIEIPNPPQTDKPIIALIHATVKGILPPVDTVETVLGGEFVIDLKNFIFCDYIALGHIHKHMVFHKPLAIYPGSMEALTWGELGKHGFVYGQFNDKLTWEYIELSTRPRVDLEFDIVSDSELKLTNINPEAIYRLTLNYQEHDIKIKNVERYFKNVFEVAVKENYPTKLRKQVNLDKILSLSKAELLCLFLGDKFDKETRSLWDEIECDVEC